LSDLRSSSRQGQTFFILPAVSVESSKVIDLKTFVPRGGIDPVYFDPPVLPLSVAVESLPVIGVAMAKASVAGIGRLTPQPA
jgi:non-homologous end joining protein Ku